MNEYSDYLSHHGIIGQKWGKQNGPPYPLSRAQAAVGKIRSKIANGKATKEDVNKLNSIKGDTPAQQKAVEKAKEETRTPRVLARAQDVYAARSYMTDKEINDYMTRVGLEAKLKAMADTEYSREHPIKTAAKKMIKEEAQNFIKKKGKEYLGVILDKGSSTVEVKLRDYLNNKYKSN